MKELIDLVPFLYFACSDDGKILEVNDELCNLLGYNRKALVGNTIDLIYTVATRIFQQTHIFPLLKMQGQVQEIYVNLLTKGQQELPVLLNIRRVQRKEKHLSLYTGMMVRNRQKFEEELLAAKKATEKALNENLVLNELKQQMENNLALLDQQMQLVARQHEELRQFNRVTSHDLQEPLRKLLLHVSLLSDRSKDEANISIATRIRHNAEKLRAIISGLQQYVWLTDSSNQFTLVDLNILLQSVQQELKKNYPDVALFLDLSELPSIKGNRSQLQMLFYQVLDNAVRFRKLDKEVHLKIEGTTLLANQFKNLSYKYKYEEVLRLQITDLGIGFDNRFKDQVFELFRRLHTQSGLGIGLSLARKIIQNHQGMISIESFVGEKTTVSIWFPLR
jgi:sigma-B regulation protein RsbU (phosphoserine phosphatase)